MQQFVLNGAGINCVDFKLVDCCNLKKSTKEGDIMFFCLFYLKYSPLWYDLSVHRCCWDEVINYSSAYSPVIVSLRTPDNGTSRMRKQKFDTIKNKWMVTLYSRKFPTGVSALQAVKKASHCQCPKPLQYRIHRQGDRKERAGSVWEKKGTVRKRTRERRRLGEWFMRRIGQRANGRS